MKIKPESFFYLKQVISLSSLSLSLSLSLFASYRPVSFLPAFSKILAKIFHNRLINFVNRFNVPSNNHYGFRKRRSTAYALIHLYDKLSDAIDQGKVTLGLFIVLSKAFDSVNHDILLAKLEFLGFVVLHYRGSKVIFLLELNLYSTVAVILSLNTSNVECLKDRF